jgi:predicted RecB family nuclease
MCVWRGVCRERLSAAGDLTLIPGLGRAVRAAIEGVAVTVADLAVLDVDALRGEGGRTALPGVGAARLGTFRERARMLVSDAPPFATRPLGLARREVEFHLDLETDPTDHDLCYFHGVVSRRRVDGVDTEEYVHFLAADRSEERDAFAAAVSFLTAEPEALVTTFSAFEATTYRRLAARYPEVASAEVIDRLFAKERCVDLYFGAVLPATNWPLNSLGLKSLGKFLGFDWNDPDASGASSISWFVDWRETRDPALLERILRYNQADCVASRVVFDALLQLPVMDAVPWPPASERRP